VAKSGIVDSEIAEAAESHVDGLRPPGIHGDVSSAADIARVIRENDIKFIDLRFADTRGKEQHVSVPTAAFGEEKFTSGHAFDGSSIAGWKGIQASDMLLMPDPSSAYLDPFT
jgi:glutamine synthetase